MLVSGFVSGARIGFHGSSGLFDDMPRRRQEAKSLSRRAFLRKGRWAPALFLPSPFLTGLCLNRGHSYATANSFFSEARLVPHYPSASPIEEMLRLVAPGADGYITEKFAAELQEVFRRWGDLLRSSSPALRSIA